MTGAPSPDPASRSDEGTALDRVVRDRGPLPLAEAIGWLIHAARVLDTAKGAGRFPIEVAPTNLAIDAAGTLRLLESRPRPLDRPTEHAPHPDPRNDVLGLGRTLFFLLTARDPEPGDTAPALTERRPDLPTAVEDAYRRMTAAHPDDRPSSMSEVIVMLEACLTASARSPEANDAAILATQPGNRRARKSDSGESPLRSGAVPSRRDDEGAQRSTRDLGEVSFDSDIRSEARLYSPEFATGRWKSPESRPSVFAWAGHLRSAQRLAIIALLTALALLTAALVHFASRTSGDRPVPESKPHPTIAVPNAPPQPEWVEQILFDGKNPQGWMLTNRRPLPKRAIQSDGLNPHATPSYLVVHEKRFGDFILDFDYKLSPGCDSGVFLRVSKLDDPVHTGIEVALADSNGTTAKDTGAIMNLVAPTTNPQKPAGAWNHMTIKAIGPSIAVAVNETEVTRFNLDQWDTAAQDRSGVLPSRQSRIGYIGFQNLVGDCWFRRIELRTPVAPRSAR